MKKTIFTVIISLLIYNELFSQNNNASIECPVDSKNNNNFISASFCTSYTGYGLRYDKNFTKIGFYVNVVYNNSPNHYVKSINDHVRFASGINYIIPFGLKRDVHNILFIGPSYNYYFNNEEVSYDINLYNVEAYKKPLSLDVGVGIIIKNFISSISFNFFTYEFIINLGFKF
jgi:hypothetical protein